MIVPFRDEDGKRNGFLAGEAVYNVQGRQLGRLIGEHVFDPKGEIVADVKGDLLIVIKPLPWPARAIDRVRYALRFVGLSRLSEVPD